MKTPKNIVGNRYGDVTVIEELERDKLNHRMFMCRCSCGAIVGPRQYSNVKRGLPCGSSVHPTKKHGESNTRLYRIWNHLKQVCFNYNHEQFKYVGARGITMCDEWDTDFRAFKAWAVANGYTDAMAVVRRDKAGNYCPENCYIKPSDHAKQQGGESHE